MRLEDLVDKYYSRLNDNDLYIWSYIIKNKKECMFLAIDELALRCNVSRTTIMRFAQKLSLKGYSELKFYLKWAEEDIIDEKLNYIELISKDLENFISEFKKKDFDYVCSLIDSANRIFVYGSGALQTVVASEMQRIFLLNDKCLLNVMGETEINLLSSRMTEDDLVILISVSGNSDAIVNIAKRFRVRNIPIISITRMKNNELAKITDENLYINTSVMSINDTVQYETVSLFFVLVEMLFLKYAIYKKNK